eukprot:8222654-Lingulodinium_polyedra.AAC.1
MVFAGVRQIPSSKLIFAARGNAKVCCAINNSRLSSWPWAPSLVIPYASSSPLTAPNGQGMSDVSTRRVH